jgi:hypothetical protein
MRGSARLRLIPRPESRFLIHIQKRRRHRRPLACCAQGTRKFTLLISVRLGIFTLTCPVVASLGTVVVISVLETTLNVAALPLKVTLVAPGSLVALRTGARQWHRLRASAAIVADGHGCGSSSFRLRFEGDADRATGF